MPNLVLILSIVTLISLSSSTQLLTVRVTLPDQGESSRGMERPKTFAATIEDELLEVWTETVEAEQRTALFTALIREGVGTKDVEGFESKQSAIRRGKGKNQRNRNSIQNNMTVKLENSKLDEADLRRERGQLRSKLESLIGNKSHRYRKFINTVKERIKKLREDIKKKNKKKVSWLKNKPGERMERMKLPEGWSRYKDLRIFTSDEEIPSDEIKPPITVGGMVKLSEDEANLLRRSPKFCVRSILNKEDFMMELEKALIKEKYNRMANPQTEDEEELGGVKNTFQKAGDGEWSMRSTFQVAGKEQKEQQADSRKRKRGGENEYQEDGKKRRGGDGQGVADTNK